MTRVRLIYTDGSIREPSIEGIVDGPNGRFLVWGQWIEVIGQPLGDAGVQRELHDFEFDHKEPDGLRVYREMEKT